VIRFFGHRTVLTRQDLVTVTKGDMIKPSRRDLSDHAVAWRLAMGIRPEVLSFAETQPTLENWRRPLTISLTLATKLEEQ
jgi:hypothetical protein